MYVEEIRSYTVQIFVNARNRLQVTRELKIIVISALVIIVLLSAIAPNVMASQGYWTPSDSYPPKGLKKYHLFLDRTFPSSAFRGAKLVIKTLTACLDFRPNYTNPKPLVCHPINEGDIPRTNDSILDAGFFIVSDRLNASDATACVRVGYNNWYSCGGTGDHSWDSFIPNIHYNMNRLIHDDVSAFDACINEYHLKEGTEDFNFCMKMLT
jgi:hypothetical protein